MSKGTWDDDFNECRLVAADGEVIARIKYSHAAGEWVVAKTGRHYVSCEQAKRAAEASA